eukprot:TRINITY_DN17815_c0_g1_i1.p1 TRINITY_DN17815_c0_g1~~TRINITY_DN17815_c0_g1_i1.p1  ORF type:complete len:160 (+),score=63.89 TRINITY_DN17815_c0_g1_i1:71-550(+)
MSKRGTNSAASEEVLDEDQVSEFKDAFELFDPQKKQYISKSDLREIFKRYGVRISDDALDEAFKEADSGKDNQIDFPEFITMMTKRMHQTSTEERLTKAFEVFDPQKTGFIATKELSEVLTTLGNPLTAKELSELIAVAENSQGQVKYSLFVNTLFSKK